MGSATGMIAAVPLGVSFCFSGALLLLVLLLSLKLAQRRIPSRDRRKEKEEEEEEQMRQETTQERRLPGPWRLPLVGSYFALRLPFRSWLPEAVKRYGDLFCFRLAGYTWVSLNTTERIQEALVKHADSMSGRQRMLWSQTLFKGSGLVLGDGEIWRKHRNLALKVLKDFGFNRDSMEDTVKIEINNVLSELPDQTHTVESSVLTKIAANIISRVVFGIRATDQEDFSENLHAVQTVVQSDVYNGFAAAVLLPFLRRCPALLSRLRRIREATSAIKRLLNVAEGFVREETLAKQNNNTYQPCTFVEAAVRIIGESSVADGEAFSEGRLAVTLFDLMIGGTDSTGSTLKWIFLRLVSDHDRQERLAEAIDRVAGSRSVTYSDQAKLPEIRAFIEEVLRLHPAVSTAVVHRTERDVVLSDGYRVPEDSWVLPNLGAAHRDSRHFQDPIAFRPDRFLDANGEFQPSPHVIAFSVGPRACIGEQLARMELFLVTATFLQHFRMQIAAGGALSGQLVECLLSSGTDGLIACPAPFSLHLTRRDGT